MKVGVLFAARIGNPGELLADARAVEAAGADSVWLQDEPNGIDPLIVLAAIAAVTNELRLGLLTEHQRDSDDGRKRRLDTLEQLSRGRLVPARERWRQVEVPADLEAWRRVLAAVDDDDGVIVPHDPRLLDMLRNADETVDRSDLQLALG